MYIQCLSEKWPLHFLLDTASTPPAHTCQPRVECYGCLCAVETIPFCNIVGLQQGQEEILQRQEVIQCGQKRQVVVTEEVLARVQGLERGQEYISRQLEPKGTVTGRSVCILVGWSPNRQLRLDCGMYVCTLDLHSVPQMWAVVT